MLCCTYSKDEDKLHILYRYIFILIPSGCYLALSGHISGKDSRVSYHMMYRLPLISVSHLSNVWLSKKPPHFLTFLVYTSILYPITANVKK